MTRLIIFLSMFLLFRLTVSSQVSEIKSVKVLNFDQLVLVFTCNGCPYAQAYQDRIVEIDKKYKSKGYPVIVINPNDPTLSPADSFDKMVSVAQNEGFTFPYLFDETQEVYRSYGATKTPHVYVLQKKGNDFVVQYIGAIDDNY